MGFNTAPFSPAEKREAATLALERLRELNPSGFVNEMTWLEGLIESQLSANEWATVASSRFVMDFVRHISSAATHEICWAVQPLFTVLFDSRGGPY